MRRDSARPCPICDATSVELLRSMRFLLPDDHPLAKTYDVVRCVECGSVHADTPSTQADYDRYYADLSKYSDATTGTGGGEQQWDRDRLRQTAIDIAGALGDTRRRIVDIGCGNGGLLAELAALGYAELHGVDPSPACAETVGRIPGVTGHAGTIFQVPEAVRGADCAILSHVLEHVRDVPTALRTLRHVVRDGGTVYVEVPDASRYTDFLVAPFQDFNVEHINHFSAVSLANALRAAGFEVEHVEQKTINASSTAKYPAVWAIGRAAQRGPMTAVRDTALGGAVNDYIAASSRLLAEQSEHLERELASVPEIVIWGAGQTTLTLLANAPLGGAKVLAIADSNPRYHGRTLGGFPVISPEQLRRFQVPIVIGSLISQAPILRRIRELGLPNRTITLEPPKEALAESANMRTH